MLKVIFVSNFYNQHQQPFSEAMNRLTSAYRFLSTEPVPEHLPGREAIPEPPFVMHFDTDEAACVNAVASSDVIIIGSVSNRILKRCLRAGKLTFFYSERPLKEGEEPLKRVPRCLKWHLQGRNRPNCYLLCAGAYVAGDFEAFHMFRNRRYKWGYFPPLRTYPNLGELMRKKDPTEIIWCGRFLEWKHPEAAVSVAGRLLREHIPFHIKMIGSGALEDELRSSIHSHHLDSYVEIAGAMTPEEVRDSMEHAGIFLFTSDRKEGWGAVLNEAMNSGCAVVANDAAGSVPFLLQHFVNGFIYHDGSDEELYAYLKQLLVHPKEQRKMGINAYHTIAEEWNGAYAAGRFLKLCDGILNNEGSLTFFPDGPCSKAEVIHTII